MLKKPTSKGTIIKTGTLKAVSIALVFPASPTSPSSTAKLLCEVLNIPRPKPANIKIRFLKFAPVKINIPLAKKCMVKPSMYVYLKPIFIPISILVLFAFLFLFLLLFFSASLRGS